MDIHLQNGTTFQGGKYKIVRFISSGGFGCTYEAVHTMLEKRVAIKEFFVKDFCNRDETTSRVSVGTVSKKGLVDKLRRKFIDEARGLCRLEHPGIVRASDVFEENGTAYFVMDYIEGKSLSEIVRERGPLSVAEALRYVDQVCDAIEYVHAHNRLHLDIKPANIMVSTRGRAVLIDFGASKQYDEEAGENTSTLMGKTPGYAPLEQMGNDVVKFTPATDIYALGATLYKILTGCTPPSANLLAAGDAVAPLPPSVDPNVRNAVEAAMQINKHMRPQTIAEFRALLHGGERRGRDADADADTDADTEVEVVGLSVPPSLPPQKSRRKLFAVIAGCCVAVIAAVAGWFLIPSSVNDSAPSNPGTRVVDKKIVNSKGEEFRFTGVLYADSIPNGEGTGRYADGVYTGEYVNGLRHGKATYVTNIGDNKFEGTYKDDQYDEGKLTFTDNGYYYEGTFRNNQPYTGSYHNADGTPDGKLVKGVMAP